MKPLRYALALGFALSVLFLGAALAREKVEIDSCIALYSASRGQGISAKIPNRTEFPLQRMRETGLAYFADWAELSFYRGCKKVYLLIVEDDDGNPIIEWEVTK